MKILFVAAEVAPFAKVGGLADVAGSLPKALSKLGNDIRVVLPCYGSINKQKYHLEDVFNTEIELNVGVKKVLVSLKQSRLPNSDVIVYFIDNNEYFGSHSEIYPQKKHAEFEQERFIVFGLATLKLMQKIGFKPDIIHCNDWHTANIPVQLKTKPEEFSYFSESAIIFSIHNLAYQGLFNKDILSFANLDVSALYNPEYLEFYGDINWMKGGIIFADRINTVSKKYAEEIQTKEYGEKLDGLLIANNNKLSGILNGLDTEEWNPKTDSAIPANYSQEDLTGKKVCKKALQKEFGLKQLLSVPLFGVVSRLVDQKGLDLLSAISQDLKDMNIQLVVLGTGQEKYEIMFKDLSIITSNIKAVIGFDTKLAKRIYASCDMFLMPSKFEPCGLGQMISLRYGTIPIVRNTGGLSDTIIDYNTNKKSGNGFVFEDYSADKLLDAITRAANAFKNKKTWNQLITRAMTFNVSWDKSAQEYLNLYKNAKL